MSKQRYDARDAARRASSTATGTTSAPSIVQTPTHELHPSPFQPAGRPSRAAVNALSAAVSTAGSLGQLLNPEGASVFTRLSQEAARLAELAYDVQVHGVKSALEARRVRSGKLELISGHRRRVAAMIAGLAMVPVLDRGAMDDAAAVAALLAANLHRKDFTTLQAARLAADLQERRQAAGHKDSVRTLAQLMGTSHGRVGTLLQIARAVSLLLSTRLGGDEVVSVLTYRQLERLAGESDEGRREMLARQMLGFDSQAHKMKSEQIVVHRQRSGGGFTLCCSEPIEAIARCDAAFLQEVMEAQLARVKARIACLAAMSD